MPAGAVSPPPAAFASPAPSAAASTTATPTATTTSSTRYQSSVAPHFPMKTMLTPRGPMALSSVSKPMSAPSSSSSASSAPSLKPELAPFNSYGGLLDANGSMAAAFAMSTAPGSSSSAATVVCKVPKFLRSLYAILQTEDPGVISWVQNQELKPNRVTAFHILDMDRFERDVLPKYFKHQKFASFQRQLNNFGFRKWTKTQSSGVCTFSHNSFPPDPAAAGGVLRASFREQWRQKSPVAAAPALAGGPPQAPPRRRVGNGITKADRKARRAAEAAGTSTAPASFMELYKSPLSFGAPKKLAGSGSGLEAFADDAYKQLVLPPLPPPHLLASTPRGLYAAALAAAASCGDEPATPSLGGFPHHHSQAHQHSQALKPFEFGDKPAAGVDAGFAGAFLEPWSWDAAAGLHPALELGAFPLDFDWHDASQQQQQMQSHQHGQYQQHAQYQMQHHLGHAAHHGAQQFANVSVSVGVAPLLPHAQAQAQAALKDASAAFCHPPERAMTPTEEFGLETFLFAE